MKTKIPTTIEESMIAIAELQSAINYFQGQINLLLGFVTNIPENREDFSHFVQAIAESDAQNIEEMKTVARDMITHGLLKNLSPQEPPPSSGGSHSPGSKIIQFPKAPVV